MNAMLHTAQVLSEQSAAQLAREQEILRRQAERPASAAIRRPTGFAVVTDWLAKKHHRTAAATAH